MPMLGYDAIKRDNYFHKIQVKNLLDRKLISDDDYQKLESQITPAYKQTNIFINVGLFVFTCVIISAVLGLLALIFSSILSEKTGWFVSYLVAVGLLFGLQKIIIDERNQFRTGIDDAVLYSALLFVFFGTFLLFERSLFNNSISTCAFFIFLFGVPARIYYDRLLFGLTFFSILSITFFLLYEIGGYMLIVIPFALMGISFFFYKIANSQIKKTSSEAIEQCWEVIEWICISVFYISGNIYVVTELSNELGLANAFPEPVRWLFYVFTIVIPILYIYWGLSKKNISFLNIGLGTLALGVFAIRYYHSILNIEYAMLLGGLILVTIAWLSMKFFRDKSLGISIDPEDQLDSGLKIESLIIDQAFGKVTGAENNDFSGKGGEFGGGGSSGSF